MSEEENIKVAVRVRPFNKREKGRKAKNVVSMNKNITTIKDPETGEERSFTYDHSYWSFDGAKEEPNGYISADKSKPNGDIFCDQKQVYNDLGKGVLDNAWNGYNSTLFAYGQTGSGKSWSVIGYGTNKGIVPMLCADLFRMIKENKNKTQCEVRFSMLEIYNEVVHDLLAGSGKSKEGLKVRQHPKKGFYAENLKECLVSSYEEIEQKMDEGTVNRTIASTNMNATSSRAHTIVGISFVQKFKNAAGVEKAKKAVVNLVDLAGSERVESTGATGERLKEGAAINLSLTSLGNCIHALAEQAQGKPALVPFRDSKLTKLLMNALGGNSKTIMIAAISPADINFDESMSTLRYADRAKQIKTKAVKNEDPTEKLISDMREENDRLKKIIESGKYENDVNFVDADLDGLDDRAVEAKKKQWMEEVRAEMLANELEMQNMKKTYEEKLKAAKKDLVDPSIKKKEELKHTKPHIFNLNQDPQLTGRIIHIITDKTTVGNRKGIESDITIVGPGIQSEHARFTNKEKQIHLKPHNTECRVLVNGEPIQGETTLCHNDRLVFGSTQIWVFQHPTMKGKSKQKTPDINYEYAQEEIAAKSGINMNGNSDLSAVQDDLLEVMGAVEEANSISGELDKRVKFEVMLVSPQMMGKQSKKTEIQVKMKNLENGTEFVWPKDKFLNRLFMMKEMYYKYEEEDEWDVEEEEDPFTESLDTEVDIGNCHVILQPLAHGVELSEQLEITSLRGQDVGVLNVEAIPCTSKGREYTEADDMFVDSPEELIGQDIHFKFKIDSCKGLPNQYTDIYCSYSIYLDGEPSITKRISDTINPSFKYEKIHSYTPATKQFIDYLVGGSVVVKVVGKQRVRRSAIPRNDGLSTKDMLKSDRQVFSKTANLMNGGFQMNGRVVDPQKQSIIVELLLMKKTQARLQQKLDSMKKLVKEAENISRTRVSTLLIKDLLNANTPEQADDIIRKLADDHDGNDDMYNNYPSLYKGSSDAKSSVCALL